MHGREECVLVSSRESIHLAAPGPIPDHLRCELAACGIRVSMWEETEDRETFQGVVVTRPTDVEKWEGITWTKSRIPRLFLVYGPDIPHGWSDQQAAAHAEKGAWDVLRMMLVAGSERALIGGSSGSFYVRMLRRHLADHQIMTLVCARREVDEVYRQLPRYLTLKEKFFLELGDLCDDQGISLQVVSRAMGMDKRVGQEWLYSERTDHAHIFRWISRETRSLLKKWNLHRVVLWGSPSFWKQMPAEWLRCKEVRLYANGTKSVPNEAFEFGFDCAVCPVWTDALKQADLLVIGEADEVIRELALDKLSQCMRQSIVVDAAACFPPQEAKSYLKMYRSIGEKTNVWE